MGREQNYFQRYYILEVKTDIYYGNLNLQFYKIFLSWSILNTYFHSLSGWLRFSGTQFWHLWHQMPWYISSLHTCITVTVFYTHCNQVQYPNEVILLLLLCIILLLLYICVGKKYTISFVVRDIKKDLKLYGINNKHILSRWMICQLGVAIPPFSFWSPLGKLSCCPYSFRVSVWVQHWLGLFPGLAAFYLLRVPALVSIRWTPRACGFSL